MSTFSPFAKIGIILAIAQLAGCSQPRLQADLREIQFESLRSHSPVIVTTPHYRIHAQCSQATADDIVRLLEALYQTCTDLLGAGQAHEQLHVYTYADRRQYEEQLKAMGLSDRFSSGMFTPGGVPGIHLPLVETGGTHPFFTLIHEGVHQYLHAVKGLPIKAAGIKLPAVPLWMSEGLALYLEAALVNVDELEPGRIHTARLHHLQQLLQDNSAPGLEKVLTKSYGVPFTNADYSVAWGIIHFLNEHQLWQEFWQQWQVAVAQEHSYFLQEIEQAPTDDNLALQKVWAQRLGPLSEKVFAEQIVGAEGLSSWQERWQNSILQLTSKQ